MRDKFIESQMFTQRARVLLQATRDILTKCNESPFVEDVMGVTAVWDNVDCDGHCLLEEIDDLLKVGV